MKAALSSVKAALSWTGAKIAAGFARVKKFLIARRNAIKDFFSVLWDLPYFPELSLFTLALRRNLIALCGVILFLLLFDIEINFRNISGFRIKGLAKYETYMAAFAIVFYFFVHYFYSLISGLHKQWLINELGKTKFSRQEAQVISVESRAEHFFEIGLPSISEQSKPSDAKQEIEQHLIKAQAARRAQKAEFWLFNRDLPLLLSVGAMIWLGVEIYQGWR